ncbi:protein roadkill-like [Musca vetustissima]|uniref:protein roadkill-like n=1 Tax=Musca vetustissima TaxID=27455 RepID=UPI002AB69B88|nr:protein roadkill-like [Musca vetustissima]
MSCNSPDTIFQVTVTNEAKCTKEISTTQINTNILFVQGFTRWVYNTPVAVYLQIHEIQHSTTISKDLANILASKEFSDLTLVSQDKIEFNVHKVLLCARSEVFAAMFRNDLEEKKTGIIQIEDMDSKVLKELLNYIYTDKKIPNEMAADLFVAGNKYAMSGLQKMCENMLIETMSVDTVSDILLLGDRHSSDRLKSTALIFAMKNIKSVSMTEGWNRLRATDNDLCTDVLEKAVQEMW